MRDIGFITKSIIAFILISGCSALQANDTFNEYHIKAAFLYNLTLMIKWPDEHLGEVSEPLSICTIGRDPFGQLLNTIQENTVRKRRLILKRDIELQQAKTCHVLFIVRSEQQYLYQILDHVDGLPILTVGDMPKFAHHGGMVNMVKRRNRIKLEINLTALKQGQLSANARLLMLAKIVDATY